MKVREDFVSNSSSTSFVVSIKKDHETRDFCQELAKASVNESYEHHVKDLEESNFINLMFSLKHYELPFLGTLVLETKEVIHKKSDLKDQKDDFQDFTMADWVYSEELIAKWNSVKDLPDGDCSKESYRFVERDYIKDDELHTFYDVESGNFGIDIDSNLTIKRWQDFEDLVESGKAEKSQVDYYNEKKKGRIEELIKIARYAERAYGLEIDRSSTYQITMNSVKNTRDLLEAGYKIKFGKWDHPDMIEKRLAAGEKIFRIMNNDSGGGMDKDAMYTEPKSSLSEYKHNIEMEYLDSERL